MSGPRPVHVLQPGPIGLWSDQPAVGEPVGSPKGSVTMQARYYVDQIAGPGRSWHSHSMALHWASGMIMLAYAERFGFRWFVHKDRETGRWLISRRFFYLQSKKDLRPADNDSERDTSAQQF